MTASAPTLRFSTQLPLNPTPPTYEAVTSPRKISFVKDKKKPKKERDLFINSNCYSLSSSERALNEDSFVLDQFLNIYNTRPLCLMIIEGYRWSKVLRKSVTCSNAYDQNDFTLTLDLSPYLPEHSPIQTTESFLSDYDSKSTTSTPSSTTQPKFGSLEETLHYFTQKDRFMQKISVKKEAQIPTQRLAELVTQLIRGEGYKHNIKITFRTYLKEIKVFSHRVDSRVARNHFLKTLACCTGLWLPILPAHRYYHNKNTIQLYANYDMCLSPEYWLINHQIQITDAVQDYLKSSIRS